MLDYKGHDPCAILDGGNHGEEDEAGSVALSVEGTR